MKKRISAYLMALCMTVTMFSGTALAEEKESATECVCTTLCTEDSVNDLCDVCKENVANCVGGGKNEEQPVDHVEEHKEDKTDNNPDEPAEDQAEVKSVVLSGNGTKEDPFLIDNAEDLKAFRDSVNENTTYENLFVKLTDNIDLENKEWTPIGNKEKKIYFKGTFNGNDKEISGLSIDTNDEYVGLFGAIEDAVIKNLTVSGSVTGINAAGIVARMNGGTVENCVNNVDVNGKNKKAGGIICLTNSNYTNNIINCTNNGDITGNNSIDGLGGIVGYGNGNTTTVDGCRNTGNIGGNEEKYAGGIIGYATGADAEVKNCENTGEITANELAGGIIGIITGGYSVKDCTNRGEVFANNTAGGIAGGDASGVVENCDNNASVIGTFAGGVCGSVGSRADVINCSGGTVQIIGGVDPLTGKEASGRLIGTVGNGHEYKSAAKITIDDNNGDDYTDIGTVGIFAPYTAWGYLIVENGTFRGVPMSGGNTGVIQLEGNSEWNDENKQLTENKVWNSSDNFKWSIGGAGCKPGKVTEPVAAIGNRKYQTLEAAVAAANDGDTIKLLNDIAISKDNKKVEYNLPDNGTLDLDGHTLDVPHMKAIFQGKNAVIEDGKFVSVNKSDYPIFIGNDTMETSITLRDITVEGGINVYAANAILENVIADASNRGYYAVWGDWNSKVTIKSGVYTAGNTGLAVSVFGGNDPDNPGHIIIEGGDFNGGLDVSKPLNDKSEYISVSGGYFTEDPSEYVVKDKTTLLSDKKGYAYMVGDKQADDPIIEKPDIAESEVDVNAELEDKLTSDQITSIKETAKSVEAYEAVVKAINNLNINSDVKEKAVEQAKTELSLPEDEEVIIYKQVFLDIEATDAKVEEVGGVEQITEVTFDITPKMQIIASTAKTADDIELDNVIGRNAVVYGNDEVLNIKEPAEITVELPDSFADEKVYIKHESDNGNYYYNATADGNVLTFVSLHGFSPFTFSLKNGSTAEITVGKNTIGYDTLEEAIDNVKDGQTIVLVKDCDEDIKVNKEISFKLDESEGELKGSIKAGSGYEMDKEKDGDITEYTFEKKSSTGHGSSFELEEKESSGDYVVRVEEGKHGEVTVSPKRADKGDTIKITVEPEDGYEIDKIKAFDEDDEEIELTEKADNKFTFKMSASDVDVEVSFKEKENKEEDKHVMPFIDVPANIWYRNAVQYVYENGIMSGTSDITFGPDMATTRGMIVTILYRMERMPKTGTANGFTDVPVGAYYEDAVAWASANNIVSGYGNGLFGPEDKVTREQMAVIIYNYHKAMGKDVSNIEGMRIYEFTDYESISDWAVTAVRYCLNSGIFNGNADGTLNPKGNVTRAELAVIINNLA